MSPDQVSIGMLVGSVPRDAVDEAAAVCGVRQRRSDGKLPPHVSDEAGGLSPCSGRPGC